MTAELSSLADALDAAVVIIHDLDGRILYWTSGCERLYGFAKAEAVGRRVADLLETRYPCPRAEIVAALAERGAWRGELEQRARSGATLTIASQWTTQKTASGEMAVLQHNADVTPLKRAQLEIAEREAHLVSILSTVPEAMIVIDEKGLISLFSAGASALFGYRPDEVIGCNVKMLMPEPYRAEHDSYVSNYLRTGEARIIGYGRLVQGVAKDGRVFPVELSVGEARANGRRVFTGFIRDLTSRQKMEQELRQSQKMEVLRERWSWSGLQRRRSARTVN